ncbi:MAG: hypothetical protein GX561_03465 [Lentisphaerae bacterium]|nr:hypothetical protein [Lentisphaerota bacterium]
MMKTTTISAILLAALSLFPVHADQGQDALVSKSTKQGDQSTMRVNPNQFKGSDSDRIDQATAAVAAAGGGTIVLTKREDPDGRTFWLIDRAILLGSEMTLLVDDCTVKLSNQARDNFVRSNNCGLGIEEVKPLQNIHIVGVGNARFVGADNPRSTGDGNKQLNVRSYGTDGGKEDRYQYGNWQNIGILMAYVNRFSVRNIAMFDSHCWGISFEHCKNGTISGIHFESTSKKLIDGEQRTFLNQDGIDLRQGCQNILIENITGFTGDDLIALTAIGTFTYGKPAGAINSTMVAGSKKTDDDDIAYVTIRNVVGHSAGRCQIIRFLNSGGIRIHHIILDGLIDNSPENARAHATIRIGDKNPNWGGVNPVGDTSGFIISNVHSYSRHCILLAGSLSDSIIQNVMNHNSECDPVTYESGKEYVRNVVMSNVIQVNPR